MAYREASARAALSVAERIAIEGSAEWERMIAAADARALAQIEQDWANLWARPAQLPPAGGWRVWLMMAGRGFGKTRAGAEWVRAAAERDGRLRIALVGATLGEARAVMVEGESGLLAIAPEGQRPRWDRNLTCAPSTTLYWRRAQRR